MQRKYSFNEDYFETVDTANKAYLLGLLATDGYVSLDKNSVVLALHKNDVEAIEFFKKEINATHKITTDRNQQKLVLHSNKFKTDLINLGITPQKTFTLKYPLISKNFDKDFIRGCIDGDGCWSFRKRIGVFGNQIKPGIIFQLVSGSFEFLNEINNIIGSKINYNKSIYKIKNSNCYELKFSGSHLCEQIYNMIYYDDKLFSLKRKIAKVRSFYAK